MLIISLPNGADEGTCKINRVECRYRLDEDNNWDHREIVNSFEASDILTTYICGDNDGIPITIIEPRKRRGLRPSEIRNFPEE